MNTYLRLGVCGIAVLVGLSGCAGEPGVGSSSEEVCAAGGLNSDVPLYQATPGTLVTWTGAASCAMPNPEYQFWIHPPGQPWTIAQAYSASNTYSWATTGLTTGTYDWQVWIREAGSSAYTETYGGRSFILTGTEACTSISTSATPTGTAVVGQSVSITSMASCGAATPTYEVWHLPPGGSWTLVQPYSTAGTYNWDTSAEATGSHVFQVWSRAQGSSTTYESYSTLSYVLTSTETCAATTLSPSPVSPAARGTTVTFSASASGCASPTYEFWIRDPSGAWSIAQAYGSSSTFSWDTTSVASGDYQFQVWTRASGSTSLYQAYAAVAFTVQYSAAATANNLAAGLYHTCILRSTGAVNCWGDNTYGQLGDGTNTVSATPVVVSGLSGATAVGAGYNHSCAIVGGAVSCWGSNGTGQLGNGTTTDSTTPVAVSGISGAVALTGGAGHTCALLSDGTVSCWGFNSQGQLGNGAVTSSSTPVSVAGLTGAVAIAAGYYHTCALLNTGAVMCWGGNNYGQLGNGTTTRSLTPVAVSGVSDARAVSTTGSSACAILFDRSVRCWGYNVDGQLGDGTTTNASSPVVVAGLSNASSLWEGHRHGCAALTDGTARCWGLNAYGELGDGTTTSSASPVTVSGLSTVSTIAVSGYHTCAALSDSTARCWGYGDYGGMGNGVRTSSSTPVVVNLP